jgi:hypothetical protein
MECVQKHFLKSRLKMACIQGVKNLLETAIFHPTQVSEKYLLKASAVAFSILFNIITIGIPYRLYYGHSLFEDIVWKSKPVTNTESKTQRISDQVVMGKKVEGDERTVHSVVPLVKQPTESDGILKEIPSEKSETGSRTEGSSEGSPLLVEDNDTENAKVIPRPLVPMHSTSVERVQSERQGILHKKNTCFAAATIQALLACNPKIADEVFSAFVEKIINGSSAVPGIDTLLEYIYKKEWAGEMGDPGVLLEDLWDLLEKQLETHLEKRFETPLEEKEYLKSAGKDFFIGKVFRTAVLEYIKEKKEDTSSIQKIVDGLYRRDGKPLETSASQPFIAVCILGKRDAKGVYDASVHIDSSPTITVTTDVGTKVPYKMASIVMYTTNHYYTLEAVYDTVGNISEWIKYDDVPVTVERIENSDVIQRRIREYGYLFFYKKA